MIWFIVITAILVLIDAKSLGVKKGLVTGLGDIGPWGWFFATLLIWIIGFPLYLYYRGDFKRAIAANAAGITPIGNNAIDDLEKLAALKDKGLVTEEEFAVKKKQLLGL